MNSIQYLRWILVMCLCMFGVSLYAQTQPTVDPLDAMIQQIKDITHAEKKHQDERVARFMAERGNQKTLLDQARAEHKQAEQKADQLRAVYEKNEKLLQEKAAEMEEKAGDLNDVFAIVRQSAIRANSTVESSMVSAQVPGRSEYLLALAKSDRAPQIEDIQRVWNALLIEINQSGKTVRFAAPIINIEGEENQQELVRVGVFTAIKDENFLRYLPASNKLVELARQPAYQYRQLAQSLSDATTEDGLVPMALDPSRGAILSLLIQSPTFTEHIAQGGVIGYLIIGLGLIGLAIILQRFVVLGLVSRKVQREYASNNFSSNSPLKRIQDAVNTVTTPSPEVLSIRLEDQMAEETSRLHKGLATVAVAASVAPLLGLLGTVTGMIQTFNSITLFGTGDPKLMSGGISVALVTTELGLAVAIPLVLLHSLITGRANRVLDTLSNYSTELFTQHVNRKS